MTSFSHSKGTPGFPFLLPALHPVAHFPDRLMFDPILWKALSCASYQPGGEVSLILLS